MSKERHQTKVNRIQNSLLNWKEHKEWTVPGSLSLDSKNQTSNTLRSNPYKKQGPRLDISDLDEEVSIDLNKMTAIVEPRMTMEKLVKTLLKQGVMPCVVPEFKGITVGGAINGAALESSSHLWGQFNDTCLSYEILLGDGSIIHASPDEHPDLFYGIAGSYGTLGVILSVELKVLPAAPWVQLSYHSFSTISEAVENMSQQHQSSKPPDCIEALVFSKNDTTVVIGQFLNTNALPKNCKKISLDKPWSPWYYQHVEEATKETKKNSDYTDVMPLEDYLFRHDRAAFWMGAYALHSSMLMRYFLDLLKICPEWYGKWQSSQSAQNYTTLKSPTFLQRLLLGWIMPSQRLYRLLHVGTEQWFADRFVIQDFYLPEKAIAPFVQQVLEQTSITPIWLCPIKPTSTPQVFSPHYVQTPQGTSSLLFDVGIYGFPCSHSSAKEITKHFEEETTKKAGRKMLYGHSYYSYEKFWELYPLEIYQELRTRFHAGGVWKELHEKVLGK